MYHKCIFIDVTLFIILINISARSTDDSSDNHSTINSDSQYVSNMKPCYYDSSLKCDQLPYDCFDCNFNRSCIFGYSTPVTCKVKMGINCIGNRSIENNYTCAFCFQLHESNYNCDPSFACRGNSKYLTNCSVHSKVLCLGSRRFSRYKTCNLVTGYKWSTALILSITLGGFGIDRFYLGYWQEGIGKLCSFGGFGVWTIVDILLIATEYLKPSDGSRYI